MEGLRGVLTTKQSHARLTIGETKTALVPGQKDHRRRSEPSGSLVEAEASTRCSLSLDGRG